MRCFFEFRATSLSDSNKSRCPPAAWWVQFPKTAQKITTSRAAPQFATLDTLLDWIVHQCVPGLTLVNDAYYDDKDCRRELSAKGCRTRYKRHEKAALEVDHMWSTNRDRTQAPAILAAWPCRGLVILLAAQPQEVTRGWIERGCDGCGGSRPSSPRERPCF